MIQLNIIGHLGKDAELKTFGSNSYLSFSVAHSEKYTDNHNQQQTKTIWVECLKKDNGSKLIDFLKKGVQVYLSGKPSVNAYIKDGKATGNQCMHVNILELLSSPPKQEQVQQPQNVVGKNEPDDLPF